MSESIVVVNSLKSSDEDLSENFMNACSLIGLKDDIEKSKTIFIKPNLTYPFYKKGVTTRVQFIMSLVSVLSEINPKIKIYVGEGEGGYNSFSMSEAFNNMGFTEIEQKHSNVKLVNISKIPSRETGVETPKGPYKIVLPEIFFDEIDFSISCPVPKVHCMTKITLSYKNQWGCLPDTMRLKNHYMFDFIIQRVSEILKFKYAFLDGKYGLDGNGPMVGDPVEINWFVASNSLGAFDMIVSEMMGFEWEEIGHLKMTSRYGLLPEREKIEIMGDIKALRRKFVLKRDLWNYPALAAFHSRRLTYLFYFSRWAKLLHDIMYSFRERPIN